MRPPNDRKASSEILWRLSVNLKRLREARGYTQKELGSLCGLTKDYISNVEQASVNISLANLEALATGLRCTARDLLCHVRASHDVTRLRREGQRERQS